MTPHFLLRIALCALLCTSAAIVRAQKITLIKTGDYAPLISSSINHAKKEVRVVLYLITYNKKYPKGPVATLLNSLIKAKQRGVKVSVLLDKNNDYRDTGKDDHKNDAAYLYLKKAGINVSYDALTRTTHSKVVVIDTRFVVVGSTNWSYAALVKNHETSLLIDSPALAKEVLNHLK